MIKLNRVRKLVIVSGFSSILAFYPVVVYGSTQKGGNFDPNEIELDSNNSTINDVINEVPTIINEVQSIWQKIRKGKIDDAIESIFGAMGLSNPTSESILISNEEDNPHANPRTPEEVYKLEQYVDSSRSEIPQKLLDVVFSPEGQETMKIHREQGQSIEKAVVQAQQATILEQQKSSQIAQTAITQQGEIVALSEKAQAEKASQDVLKALAEQNEYLAQIITGNARQLANLGQIGTYQSLQLSGINAQLGIMNQKTEVLEVLMAAQNYQLAQMIGGFKQQKDYQQYKDSLQKGQNRGLSQMVFIPGLYPREENE